MTAHPAIHDADAALRSIDKALRFDRVMALVDNPRQRSINVRHHLPAIDINGVIHGVDWDNPTVTDAETELVDLTLNRLLKQRPARKLTLPGYCTIPGCKSSADHGYLCSWHRREAFTELEWCAPDDHGHRHSGLATLK